MSLKKYDISPDKTTVDLPEDMLEYLRKSSTGINNEPNQLIKHEWLYSFLPAKESVGSYSMEEFYFLAFCKGCRNTVSVRMNRDSEVGQPSWTQTNIPKYGCQPVED